MGQSTSRTFPRFDPDTGQQLHSTRRTVSITWKKSQLGGSREFLITKRKTNEKKENKNKT